MTNQLTFDFDAIATPDASRLVDSPGVQSILGSSRYDAIIGALGQIEYVEQQIAHAILAYKTREDALRALGCSKSDIASQTRYTPWYGDWPLDHVLFCTFLSCRSPVFQPPMPDSLYEVHVRQYLRQVAAGLDPDRPTPTELSVMVTFGCTHTAPPKYEVARLFQSNRETMLEGYAGAGFDKDGFFTERFAPYSQHMGSSWWEEGADTMRKFYRHQVAMSVTGGNTRSEILTKSIKGRLDRMIDYQEWARKNK